MDAGQKSAQEFRKETVVPANRKPAAPAPAPALKPVSATPMEKAIRDTLTRRGISSEVIESYIKEKKAKGAL